jgi:predicted enzyme related to lactoylglutathione lyase
MSSVISWFEIPVTDMDRAIKFYSTILGKNIERAQYPMPYAFLPAQPDEVGGALTQSENHVPGAQGVIIYLSGGDDLSGLLSRVELAGGSIVAPKTEIGGGMGFFALFLDSEGNKIGVHSMH